MAPGLGPDTLAEIISAAAAVGSAFVAAGQWVGVDFGSERRARQRHVDFLCKQVTRLGTQLAPLLNPKKGNAPQRTPSDAATDNTSRRVRFDAVVLIVAIVWIAFLTFLGYAYLSPMVAYAAVLSLFSVRSADLRKLRGAQSSWNKVADEIEAAVRETDRNKGDLKKELIEKGILNRLEKSLEGIAGLLGGVKVDTVAVCLGFSLFAAADFITKPSGPFAWFLLVFLVGLACYGAYMLVSTEEDVYDYKVRIQDSGYQVEVMRAGWIQGRVRLAEGGVGFGPEAITITGIGRNLEFETEGKYRTRVPWKRVWSLEVIQEMELPEEPQAVPSS